MVESVVVADVDFTAVFLNGGPHRKGTKVGHHIYQKVEHEGGHALCCAVHNGQYQIASLRDSRECHEALEVVLANGKEVGHGDRGYDDPVHGGVPAIEEVALSENLHQDGEQHKGCRAFRDYAQVGCNRSGRTFISIGCPKMEGNK